MTIKKSIRKKMNRSGKMECSICHEQHILIDHHISGREVNNYNHRSNRCNICSNCHRDVHEGIIIIEGWRQTSKGLMLLWHSKNAESLSGNDSKCYQIPN